MPGAPGYNGRFARTPADVARASCQALQLIADYFPLILFFVAYKWQGIYAATAVAIAASVAQIAYFAWRQDVVGVLGQCSGVVIYARNIRLIYKHRRRMQATASDPA